MSKPRRPSAKNQSSQPSAEEVQHGVNLLQYRVGSAYLATSMGGEALNAIPQQSYYYFVNSWLQQMQPRDNCERSLLELALFTQFKAEQLMAESTTADLERAAIYLNAAPKFLAEARKLFLTFREYRSPAAAPQVNVVQQTFTGDQQVAVVAAAAPAAPAKEVLMAIPSQLAAVIAETNASVAAIATEPTKTTEELLEESFMATPEVREHLAKMDAAAMQPRTLKSSCPASVSADVEVNCVFGI